MRPFGTSGPDTPKAQAHRRAAGAVNTPKHKLIDIVAQLRTAGANGKANSLENIIRRLEEWQRP